MVMVATRLRRVWVRAGRHRRAAALLAALALCACAWLAAHSAPAPLRTEARFPHVAPRTLALALADFTNHPRLYPHLGEWTVEAESRNHSAWRYEVAYACGARCSGHALVLALDAGAGPSGSASASADDAHTVIVSHRSCTRVPLLPWPYFCDEWETEAAVGSDGAGGAVLLETARGACGVWGTARRLIGVPMPSLAPAPGCTNALRHARDLHLRRLQLLLHNG